MGTLRFGIKLSQGATIDTLTHVWEIADEAGFDHCWTMGHFASLGPDDTQDIFEAWTMLAGMAALTTRERIGCAVTGNAYRHPGVLAKMAVTVDHLSGGRLEFGIGAGWAETEHVMLGLPYGTDLDRRHGTEADAAAGRRVRGRVERIWRRARRRRRGLGDTRPAMQGH